LATVDSKIPYLYSSKIAVTTTKTHRHFPNFEHQKPPENSPKTSENPETNTSIFAKRIIHNKYTVVLYV
jgi:hypothetical protein